MLFKIDIPTDINEVVGKVLTAGKVSKCLRVCENYRRITKCIVCGYYGASYQHQLLVGVVLNLVLVGLVSLLL